MSVPNPNLTCLTCKVIFSSNELQRNHYRCDWHRYNLKRKVASLPAVGAEEFAQRVLLQKEQAQQIKTTREHCKDCKKSFASEQALENHLQSKRHLDVIKKLITEDEKPKRKNQPRIRPPVTEKLPVIPPSQKQSDDDWEDVASDDGIVEMESDESLDQKNLEEMNQTLPVEPELADCIPLHVCLFCNRQSNDMDTNLKHMASAHSFFVPDTEYLVDLEGLIKYLGYKVGAMKICLLCDNDQKTPFRSILAVQQHMLDLGHTAMYFDNALEYAEFYDYSSTHPEGTDPDQEFDGDFLHENADWTLQLPSGAYIGHRSLMRYYRQRLPAEIQPINNRRRGALLFQTYKSLGWTGCVTKDQAMAKARDQKFAQRLKKHSDMRLGCKANKLQHHFRMQVMF